MFAVAILAKKIPRMNVVDAEGIIIFPSAVYFPLPLATIVNMRVELVRNNLLQLSVSQHVVAELRLVATLREALKWHAIYKAWCNLRAAQGVLMPPSLTTQELWISDRRCQMKLELSRRNPRPLRVRRHSLALRLTCARRWLWLRAAGVGGQRSPTIIGRSRDGSG